MTVYRFLFHSEELIESNSIDWVKMKQVANNLKCEKEQSLLPKEMMLPHSICFTAACTNVRTENNPKRPLSSCIKIKEISLAKDNYDFENLRMNNERTLILRSRNTRKDLPRNFPNCSQQPESYLRFLKTQDSAERT